MIALAITCLLVATMFAALLSASDSLLRGWLSYGALARELRALRAGDDASQAVNPQARVRRATGRPTRRPNATPRSSAAGLRAAA